MKLKLKPSHWYALCKKHLDIAMLEIEKSGYCEIDEEIKKCDEPKCAHKPEYEFYPGLSNIINKRSEQ